MAQISAVAKNAVDQYLNVANIPSSPEEWSAWQSQWLSLYSDPEKVEIFNYARSLRETPIVKELINFLIKSSSPPTTPTGVSAAIINWTNQPQASGFVPAQPAQTLWAPAPPPHSPLASVNLNGSPRKHGSHSSHNYFKPNADLTEREQAFCRCEVHILEKNDDSCQKSDLGTSGCVNPFALCRRTGGYNRKCGESYDFQLFTQSELEGYVRQRIGPVPAGADRNSLLNMIAQWKGQER